jgi:hypothetical protein
MLYHVHDPTLLPGTLLCGTMSTKECTLSKAQCIGDDTCMLPGLKDCGVLQAEEEAASVAGTVCNSPGTSIYGSMKSTGRHRQSHTTVHAHNPFACRQTVWSPLPCLSQQQTHHNSTGDAAPALQAASPSTCKPWQLSSTSGICTQALEDTLLAVEQHRDHADGFSLQPVMSEGSGRDDTSSLAATFCQEVKAKFKRLQEDVEKRDSSIAGLHVELQHREEQHQCATVTLSITYQKPHTVVITHPCQSVVMPHGAITCL